jgi:hypothetical protein
MTQHTLTRFRGFQGPNYTQVPDAVFDELLPDLTGAELKVLLYVIRRTFGFKRESDHISLSQMLRGIRTKDGRELDRGVGLTKKTLLAAINSLEEKNIILTERRRSVDRGDEPTTYRLNVVDPTRGVETTPPVGEKVHQGGGEEIPPRAWGKNSPTQETGSQETGKQQTENVSLSKFRQGEPKILPSRRAARRSASPMPTTPTGFTSVGSVLTNRPHPTGRGGVVGKALGTMSRGVQPGREAPPAGSLGETETEDTKPGRATAVPGKAILRTQKPQDGRQARRPSSDTSSAPEAPVSRVSEERELVAAYIADFAREFHDQASLKASVTRAVRLLSESGYPRERWSEKLYEARALTRERSAAIGYQGNGKPRAGGTAEGLINKMPYYFELLACVLGLHDHPAGQHPLPLSKEEFKRRQGRAAKPERKSLAGRYAHLVRR